MAARPPRYPTAPELRHMSLQELTDRKLLSLAPGSFGALDTRPR